MQNDSTIQHDMLLMALLESIGAKDAALGEGQNPEFIATLILELWKRNGKYYIKVKIVINIYNSKLMILHLSETKGG